MSKEKMTNAIAVDCQYTNLMSAQTHSVENAKKITDINAAEHIQC